jgi:hypothetical protein
MKKKGQNWLLFGGIALVLLAAVLIVNSARTNQPPAAKQNAMAQHNHSPAQSAIKHVPAYQMAPVRASLGPTLDPEKFTGMTRDAYRAAKQIPMTLAQLPCYCHCDEGFGHKSLYSCYEDDHAAHCAVCINEALLALSLDRQKLSPAEIRQRIIQQYSEQ